MNCKQKIFVNEYLRTWNATRAAEAVGYMQPHSQGPRLLENVGVSESIRARINETAMSADEVLLRLADHARGTMADFLAIDETGAARIDLRKAERAGKSHLVKAFSDHPRTGVRIELYDAQAALSLMARAHGMSIEKLQVSGRDGGPIEFDESNWKAERERRLQSAGELDDIECANPNE